MFQVLGHDLAHDRLRGAGLGADHDRLGPFPQPQQTNARGHGDDRELIEFRQALRITRTISVAECQWRSAAAPDLTAVPMSFQIRPIKEFLVRPALPAPLRRLPELGLNVMWSWNHSIRSVFRRLDPALWKASGYNPVVMLGRVSQETLERAAGDPRFLALYRRACELYDAYLAPPAPADSRAWTLRARPLQHRPC